MAPHSSTLAWKIPWTEEPGRLQSMGLLGVGHDWATSLSLFTFMHWRRKWQPTPVFLPLENPRDGGAWWAAVYGVAQSQTWLKWLSSMQWKASGLWSLERVVCDGTVGRWEAGTKVTGSHWEMSKLESDTGWCAVGKIFQRGCTGGGGGGVGM